MSYASTTCEMKGELGMVKSPSSQLKALLKIFKLMKSHLVTIWLFVIEK